VTLHLTPVITATLAHRKASSDCCGAKLGVSTADEGTSCWICSACGRPCDRVLGPPEEVTARG